VSDTVERAQEVFRETALPSQGAGALPGSVKQVRPDVLDSWLRCQRFGVDPDHPDPPADMSDERFARHREQHPLAAVMPVVRSLLVQHAVEEDLLVAVSDVEGRLLWVEGHPGVRSRAARMGFTEGVRWDEQHAGTNAPGLALELDRGVRVQAAEHWARPVHPFSCSATPVHDPTDGTLLGALDVTGDARAASPAMLALVNATVAAIERELLVRRLDLPVPAASGGLKLSVLGRDVPRLTRDGRTVTLGLRHAEILLLLAEHPEGVTAEQLAIELDERELDQVTVRAEMSRLRRVIGSDRLSSRPYRLTCPLTTDAGALRRRLADDPEAALSEWKGGLLPRSASPGVSAVRDRLEEEARATLRRRRDPALLLRWLESPSGRDDLELWTLCCELLPSGVMRDRAEAQVRLLDREFGGFRS
jgi:transcriptional regulator of acetoin/glycerol metabolism